MSSDDIKHIKIIAIVAHGKNFEIGLDNKLLWHISSDLRRFKKLTLGHLVVMGRKTYESVGRPLPGRKNIILTREKSRLPSLDLYPDCLQFSSKEDILMWVKAQTDVAKIFILGGGEIYQEWFPLVDSLYVTVIDYEGEADTFFPKYDLGDWNKLEEEFCHKNDEGKSQGQGQTQAQAQDQYDSHFMVLSRKGDRK